MKPETKGQQPATKDSQEADKARQVALDALAESEAALAKSEEARAEAERALAAAQAGRSEAEAKAKENWDQFLRARADLENYRRRIERDLELMVRRGKRDMVLRLLDVVDALERATEWEGSAELITRQLLKVLADEGVKPIECAGQPFDPAVHEAVDVRTDPAVGAPTVTDVLQKGYTWEGEVLRPARVRVTQPPG